VLAGMDWTIGKELFARAATKNAVCARVIIRISINWKKKEKEKEKDYKDIY
jgi:hypothetical protein